MYYLLAEKLFLRRCYSPPGPKEAGFWPRGRPRVQTLRSRGLGAEPRVGGGGADRGGGAIEVFV